MERVKETDVEKVKSILKLKQARIKLLTYRLKKYQACIKKLEKIKNLRLRDLEHIPDYSLRLYRLRKNEVTSVWCAMEKEIKKLEKLK